MSDVLARLMRWMENSDIDDADIVLRDAITEIAGLRARIDELRRASPTLTDAERAAVWWAIGSCEIEQTTASDAADRGYKLPDTREWAARHGERSATLRGLLERLSPPAT